MYLLWTLLAIVPVVIHSAPLSHKNRVDLTHVYDENIPEGFSFKGFIMNKTYYRSPDNYTVQGEQLSMPTHQGTHMDAPVHFNEAGWTLDAIPPERLHGPAVVVDVQNKTETNASYAVSVADLQAWEEANGNIPEESFVLIRTGYSRYWYNKTKYFGTDIKDSSKFIIPGLSGEAAKFLVEQRNVLGVGLDSLSLDASPSKKEAHLTVLGANRIALENLNNLDQLPNTGIYLSVRPLKLKGASGAPANIVAYFQ